MCTINHLSTVNDSFGRKSPRPVKSTDEAAKIREKSLATPLDKRIATLEHACESCFNEEMKMESHNGHKAHQNDPTTEDIVEHCKWLHRRAVQHTMKGFISAVATLNQDGYDAQDNARMVDMLKHQSEIGT